jgi:hypothetical protein
MWVAYPAFSCYAVNNEGTAAVGGPLLRAADGGYPTIAASVLFCPLYPLLPSRCIDQVFS